MKCDETKPTCQQCQRRGVTCGGYPKFLRWRPVGNAEGLTFAVEQYPQPAKEDVPPAEESRLSPADQLQSSSSLDVLKAIVPAQDPTESQNEQTPDAVAFGERSSVINDMSEEILGQSPRTDGFQHLLAAADESATLYQFSPLAEHSSYPNLPSLQSHQDLDWDIYHYAGLFESTATPYEDVLDGIASHVSEPEAEPDAIEVGELLLDPLLQSTSPDGHQLQDLQLYDQPRSPVNGSDMIRHLFETHTCRILSIKDDQARNPWKTLIWPLASDCPPLHHALAAMACLHLGKSQPQLRVVGIRHFDLSLRTLSQIENTDDTLIETMIATRLALGFAEAWDYQKSSTGIDHINHAKQLVRQAASQHKTSRLTGGALSRLSFLANTCLYMDVVARLTCPDSKTSTDPEFMTACNSLSGPVPRDQQLDPLMGCAITLFPLIGRLADLVGRVRRRRGKWNSPAIISTAIELRMAIERWHPLVDLGNLGLSSNNIRDSIQSAEAYRWASLLLIRQAVPELPWTHSTWELAQKALVFLATVPLTSRTTIVQIFPLMMAGCEAFDVDDREWVRERWELMSKRMVTGIVHRCKDITIEAWRRRDEYEAQHGVDASGHHKSSQQTSPSPTYAAGTDGPTGNDGCTPSQDGGAEAKDRFGTEKTSRSDFPDSAAFKKGVDPITRAGRIEYTVRGSLHWLAVMKDWGWEGEYQSCDINLHIRLQELTKYF